jgi:hypothetical protein
VNEQCRSCGAEVIWARTRIGKLSPMQLDARGTWVIVDGVARTMDLGDEGPYYSSHFSTCPDAGGWRKRK